MGLLVFVVIAVALAIPAHLMFRSFTLAVASSAVSAAVLFQVVVTLQLGYVDKFVAIALITTTFMGAVVSAVVGASLRRWSRRRPRQDNEG